MVAKFTENDISKIKVAGWQKLSLIDYPNKMAAVIFLAGCNMCCHYCHNHHIWDVRQNRVLFIEILAELRQRVGWLDAVVVSGGEPTIAAELISMLRALRELGLLIKLDTNGTRPEVVRRVVDLGLVDYVALDIKAPPAKYVAITGVPIDKVLVTARFLKKQTRVLYMFRTTLSPRLDKNDLLEMGQMIINGASCWQIQQCRINGAYPAEKVYEIANLVKNYALHIVVKGV